jgi:hypothetical protein
MRPVTRWAITQKGCSHPRGLMLANFVMLVCPGSPVLGSGMTSCSVEGFSPLPEGFVKPAPGVDHGISDGEYDE